MRLRVRIGHRTLEGAFVDLGESEEVEGGKLGPFLIHPSIHSPELWTVTHIQSTFAASQACRTREQARKLARVLRKLDVDWDFTDPDAVKSWPRKLKGAIRALVEEHEES